MESVRLEGDETPPQSLKNFLVSYDSPLHGDEVETPMFSEEPIFLSGDDGEEYFLLGEDEDTGFLVYGFEDENDEAVLVYGDYDGNIHEIETLEGFGGFKGFKGFKAPKLPKMPKIPKFKAKFKAPKFKTKGLTKGFRNVGKSVTKGVGSVTKGISSGVKAYGKAWSDVGKGLSKGVSALAKGAGNVLSQVAEGAGGLLSPDGGGEQPEEEEEEQPEEDLEASEFENESPSEEEEQEPSEYSEEDEMNGELGFAQFIPMALSAAGSIKQGVAKKKAAKTQAKNKRNTALLDLIKQTRAPVKVKKAASKVTSIKVSKPKAIASSKAGGLFDSEITHSIKEDSKIPLILGGVAVVGAIFLLGKKSK
ncbi:MAG: hypothetical protein SH817_10350 [Leptospira sp.]|nr:hypothetical protein [Leptospira sp.]